MAQHDEQLEALAAQWRRSGAPEDLTALARRIPAGTPRERLHALLGEPLVVSTLAFGGETWLYVKADPGNGRFESLSIAVADDGGFLKLDRKPIE